MASRAGPRAQGSRGGPISSQGRDGLIWRSAAEGLSRARAAARLGIPPDELGRRLGYLKAMHRVMVEVGTGPEHREARGGRERQRSGGVVSRRRTARPLGLAEQDAEIWRRCWRGWTEARIAKRLGLTKSTVQSRVRSLHAVFEVVCGPGEPGREGGGDRAATTPRPRTLAGLRREARHEKIRALSAQGWGAGRIAGRLGVSGGTVYRSLRAIKEGGAGPAAIAASPAEASPIRRGEPPKVPRPARESRRAKEQRLRAERSIRTWQLAAEGLGAREVAARLGVSTGTVYSELGYLRAMRAVMTEGGEATRG